MSSIDINKLSCGGSGYIEQVIESVKNQFWKDVLYAWKSVIEKDENKDWTNFLANTVWLNKHRGFTIFLGWRYFLDCRWYQTILPRGLGAAPGL